MRALVKKIRPRSAMKPRRLFYQFSVHHENHVTCCREPYLTQAPPLQSRRSTNKQQSRWPRSTTQIIKERIFWYSKLYDDQHWQPDQEMSENWLPAKTHNPWTSTNQTARNESEELNLTTRASGKARKEKCDLAKWGSSSMRYISDRWPPWKSYR